jgi:hypothetical protein
VKVLFAAFATLHFAFTGFPQDNPPGRDVSSLIRQQQQFKAVPFGDVIRQTTGKRILPIELSQTQDRELITRIGTALDEVLRHLNAAEHPAQKEKRINEVSSHVENELQRVLNETPDFSCAFPRTTSGAIQRSGYPDLRLVDKKSGRVIYLDPKLYERGSGDSTFRTFYFEPKKDTNKIHDDGHHLLVGFEHQPGEGGGWQLLQWQLVDLSKFNVRLKTEFQGSNKDLYRPEAIVSSSRQNAAKQQITPPRNENFGQKNLPSPGVD